jgi:tol-pal system protein YbgF
MRKHLLVTTFLCALVLAGPAAAQSTKERVTALEQAVSDLQARAPSASDSALRINRLEQEIQALTGRIEELSHELEVANSRLEAVTAALQGGGGAGAMAGAPAATGAPQALGGPTNLATGDPIADQIQQSGAATAPGGAEIALPADAQAAFDYASGFLMRGDYASAQRAFELYVQAFPNHQRTADAQFRLGEIYLATGANAEAADAFIAHIRKFPNDPRAAEAYLKLGTAFSRMSKGGEACEVFKTMKAKYPNASPAVMQRADTEMARINCR